MEVVPSPQVVGREFVRQYYTLLNKSPSHLHRFYNHDSSFVHGGLKEQMPEVHGQLQIHQKIMELAFNDCKAKILLVDAHRTLENGVVVQVSGELSNNGQPMRRFVQTFVLAPQSAKKYYVRNDIFRYQDDVFSDDEDVGDERPSENETEIQQQGVVPSEVNHQHAAPTPAAASSAAQSEISAAHGHPPGINGTDHHDEIAQRITPSTFTAAPVAQPEPVASVPQPVKTPSPPAETPEEKVEETAEPAREPEPIAAEPAPVKRAPEPAPVPSQAAPSEPKTFANLFKTSTFNGTATGLPSTVPPFGSAKPATTTSSATTTATQTSAETTSAPTNVNGNDSFPAPSSHPQKSNFRQTRPAIGGAGRGGSGPGSYKERDNERGDKAERWSDNRAPSRDSNEEIGEWKQPNGDGYQRDREFRRYDDSVQVFVGNIPHSTSEETLKELFEKFGTVLDVRIQGKNGVRASGGRAPLYAFIVFELAKSVEAALADKPMLNGDHRLNVEPKRRGGVPNANGPQRGGSMNRGGAGGPGRGGRQMGMSGGPPREGGSRGGMGGRGGYVARRQ